MKSKIREKYKLLKEKNENLIKTNKQLTKQLISLKQMLTISEQRYQSIDCAFDLSQKLVQHLKTENQLLRSTQDLYAINNPLADQPMNNNINDNNHNTSSNGNDLCPTIGGPLLSITDGIDISNHLANEGNDCVNSDGTQDNSNLCNSDLIAVQYENEIKELREDCDLLSLLAIEDVVVSVEDQLSAKKYLSDESSTDDDYESDEQMDVDFNDKSLHSTSKSSDTLETNKVLETNDQKSEFKCKYCGRKFINNITLEEHKLLHKTSDGQQIRCAEDLCGVQCDSKHELKEHLKNCHRNQDKPNLTVNPLRIRLSAGGRIFQCKECLKQLSSQQSLKQHQRVVHNIISYFKCKFSGCDMKFEKVYELRTHEEVHRKQHQTDFKLTPTKTVVVSPYFSQPNGEKKSAVSQPSVPAVTPMATHIHKCQFAGCLASYRHKTSLKRHEERSHFSGSAIVSTDTTSAQSPVVVTPEQEMQA